MVLELCDLALQLLAFRQVRNIADVVMRADEGEMVGLSEERAERFDFRASRFLSRSKRVETDDDQRIDAFKKTRIERRERPVVGDTLDLP